MILLSTPVFSSSKKFSDTAWKRIEPLYQKILRHPFNQELANGILPQEKFNYYKAQDALYLKGFAKTLEVLASKIEDPKTAEKVLQLAQDCLNEASSSSNKMEMNLANIGYTSFLLATAAYNTREELVAALLPCFWIYLRVAEDLKTKVEETNPYAAWFKTYYSEAYRQNVLSMINISDTLAKNADDKTLGKMFWMFEIATRWELAFWDASYR